MQEDEPRNLVRLVVAPDGQVAVDLAGGGRGAYVHPRPRCLALAPRGLTKSLRRRVDTSAGHLGAQLEEAARRRVAGLLGSAVRSRQVTLGAENAGAAWQSGKVELLVVARDAAAGAMVGSVMNAIAQGGAVAWGTKAELGKLLGRSEVGVLGISSRSIASAIRSAMVMITSVGAREAMQQSLVGGAVATEDR
jgi:predicted RNA-binding protein YlxR (DUF448 family)